MTMEGVATEIDQVIEAHRDELRVWFRSERAKQRMPIYGSVDVRDAGWKVASVDANHFPAGFNNIPSSDHPQLTDLLRDHILRNHGDIGHIHLYPEANTRNAGYVDNIATLRTLLLGAGYVVTVGSEALHEVEDLHGFERSLHLDRVIDTEEGLQLIDGRVPDLVLLNNDLTGGLQSVFSGVEITPPLDMGWDVRRKSDHFREYDQVVDEVCDLLDLDPWVLRTEWFVSEDKCIEEEACIEALAKDIDDLLASIQSRYRAYGIDREPRVFIKNDRGTYGLGILTLSSGSEFRSLSNRRRNRLMHTRAGGSFENFLIQEAVPTRLVSEGRTLEPVVYLVDGEAASWFYRANSKKGDVDNLNSPSSRFLSKEELGEDFELPVLARGRHALVSELAMLAMAREHVRHLNVRS